MDVSVGKLIFEGLTGSYAYGLAGPNSDQDRRGVFVAVPEAFWRMDPPKPTVELPNDATYWEIGHYLKMLRKGSVNAFELMWLSDDCLISKDNTLRSYWDRLFVMRSKFFTHNLWKGWNGVISGHQHGLEKYPPGHPSRAKEVSQILRLSLGLEFAVGERIMPVRLEGSDLEYLRELKYTTNEETILNGLALAGGVQEAATEVYSEAPWSDEDLTPALNDYLVDVRADQFEVDPW